MKYNSHHIIGMLKLGVLFFCVLLRFEEELDTEAVFVGTEPSDRVVEIFV